MALTTSDLQQIRDIVYEIVFEGMQATVDALNPRFEILEQGQQNLGQRQENLGQRQKKLAQGQARLEQNQTETNRRLGMLEQRFDTFGGRLEAVENDFKELYYLSAS